MALIKKQKTRKNVEIKCGVAMYNKCCLMNIQPICLYNLKRAENDGLEFNSWHQTVLDSEADLTARELRAMGRYLTF